VAAGRSAAAAGRSCNRSESHRISFRRTVVQPGRKNARSDAFGNLAVARRVGFYNTMIYVTHDQVEAMTMGDRICVMRDGLIMQIADPLTLYRKPDNLRFHWWTAKKGKVQRRNGGLFFAEAAEKDALTSHSRTVWNPSRANSSTKISCLAFVLNT